MLGNGLSRRFSGEPLTLTIAEDILTDDDLFNTLIQKSSKLPKKLTISWPACIDVPNLGSPPVVLLKLHLGSTDEDGMPSGEGMSLSVVSGKCAISLVFLTTKFSD